MLTTILFDLDGTLLPFAQDDFIRCYFKALAGRLAPMGYESKKLTDAIWKGTAAMIANDGQATNRQAFWACFTQEMGIEALALEGLFNDFYARDFNEAKRCLQAEPDHGPLLQGLREKGYGLVLATNPIFPLVAVESRLGWVGLKAGDFDFITTYENSRRSKPNPGYYLDILQQTGRDAGSCLMIGNNPVDDAAAQKAGIQVYLVTDCLENPQGLPIDGYSHGSFQELQSFLEGLPALYAQLAQVDPDAAGSIHPNDEKRIIRALEVFLSTGKPLSQHDRESRALPNRYTPLTIVLNFAQRPHLWERIDRRVDQMMAQGLEGEVRALLESGIPPDCTAMQAIGYKELAAAIRSGLPVQSGAEEVKLRSRQYAKRQLTWFRRNRDARWFEWEKIPDFSAALSFSTELIREAGLQ